MKSNFSCRELPDHILNRYGNDIISFKSVTTNPDSLKSIIRRVLDIKGSGDSDTKRRAFKMYQNILKRVSSKPDNTELKYIYKDVATELLTPFIGPDGKYVKDVVSPNIHTQSNILNNIRIKLILIFKKMTKCDNINIIFKDINKTDMPNPSIFMYINNNRAILDATSEDSMIYSIKSTGVELNKDTTLSILIPMEYIKKMVELGYSKATSKSIGDTEIEKSVMVKPNSIINYVEEYVGIDVFNALFSALYKDIIFSSFAKTVVNICSKLTIYHQSIIHTMATKEDLYKYDIRESSLRYENIKKLLNESGIEQLNPLILMDIFEISDSEINDFCRSLVRQEDVSSEIMSPKNYYLRYDDMDKDSSISSSSIYTIRLSYCVLALALITKDSIRESTRLTYGKAIITSMSSLSSHGKSSVAYDGKTALVEEINCQLGLLDAIFKDIIKLKKFVTGI